jgi:hypothetical protein
MPPSSTPNRPCALRMGRHPVTRPVSTILSLALSSQSSIEGVLGNVLEFTVSTAFIHMSSGSVLTNRTMSWVQQQERLILNPKQLRVSKLTPGPLAAHLSNFALCEQLGMPCAKGGSARYFVLLAANQVLVRHGLEAWVESHSASFCINHCADVAATSLVLEDRADRHILRGLSSWSAAQQRPGGELWIRTQAAAQMADDSAVVSDPDRFFEMFFDFMHDGLGGALPQGPCGLELKRWYTSG